MGDYGGHFRTTRWSLITELGKLNSSQSREILNTLFEDYWRPVYCYIVRSGVAKERAKDMTQDFFCDFLFEKNLFEKARHTKGKFRSLLLTSLRNFLISQNRYETAQKRNKNRELLNTDLLETFPIKAPPNLLDQDEIFNYSWITALLDNVSNEVEDHFCSKGMQLHWIAFDKRLREPILDNKPAPPLRRICQLYGIENEVKASNMITSVKRCFQKTLRRQVREYVYTDSDVDEELSELLSFLQKTMQDE